MNRYEVMGRHLLERAQQSLADGDLIQASEKGWGAAAQAMKAAADRRSWQHNSHGALFQIASRLAAETGDRRIRELFSLASALHTNFYEHWMPQDMVADNLESVAELVEKLEAL